MVFIYIHENDVQVLVKDDAPILVKTWLRYGMENISALLALYGFP